MNTASKIHSNPNNETDMNQTITYTIKNEGPAIQAIVQNSAKLLAPVWPLETFIACNPLQGFESMPFDEAIIKNLNKKEQNTVELDHVNREMIKWCSAFLDLGQSTIEMPEREKGFYCSFLQLALFDKELHQNKINRKEWLSKLPKSAEKAISTCLDFLKVYKDTKEAFIDQTLLYLPGWAGLIKWRSEWRTPVSKEETPINLVEFLAVRLVITCLLWPNAAKTQKESQKIDTSWAKKIILELTNRENNYRKTLLSKIVPEIHNTVHTKSRSNVQMIFCIDVRSEPFRRAVEQLGDYETLGFAGFFGLPIRVQEHEHNKTKDCCPVLLKPRFNINNSPLTSSPLTIKRYEQGNEYQQTLIQTYQNLKYNFSTPFALVESLGGWAGLSMFLKSIAPNLGKQLRTLISNKINPPIQKEPDFELDPNNSSFGISLREQVDYSETILKLMGLTSHFAKIILLCGHGSTTENNPYASALDCGACGGNHGAVNAQLLAKILNKESVRRGLEEKGIHIPFDTVFYGALHNTTTDSVEIYQSKENKIIYPSIFDQLIIDLKEAQNNNNLERGNSLNTIKPGKDIKRRSNDWSETRPEWGLARNAAFIVGPRSLTKNINLDGRCFLHSYLWQGDEDGTLLETILTAPMVVAQWINTQYLFSTLDNVNYGSGSKITHNVTGKLGVMQGNGSDLMHGLPLQSVNSSDRINYHQSQRLLTVVYAPREKVSQLINKQDILKTLFYKEWVHLVVIDPKDNVAYKLEKSGDWIVAN